MTTQEGAPSPSAGLYRYTIAVAVCALLIILSGACITSSEEQSLATDQSAVSAVSQLQTFDAAYAPRLHMILAAVVGLLTMGLVVWLFFAEKKGIRRMLGGAALILFGLGGWTGGRGVPPLSVGAAIPHAVLAHLFLSTLVMIALFSSPAWAQPPEVIGTGGRNWLPTVALLTPFMVLVQVTLGALYRHNVTGVLWHMGGALVAVIMILIVTMTILQHFPDHPALHAAAVGFLTIVLIQITLGIVTFVIKLLSFESTLAFLLSSVFHVMIGSLTLAVSIVMAFQANRNFSRTGK